MLKDNDNLDYNQYDQFNIQLKGYEGPIDLLLDLARKQKVDLSEISILDLAEQYIIFINKYKELHLEVAADYLVMAAWLTYLKSRLLLPKSNEDDEYTSEELEQALKYQLLRLEAMQNISKLLYSRPLIDRDIFYGGSLEGIKIEYEVTYDASLYDLLKNYSAVLLRSRNIQKLTINSSDLFSVDHAIKRLTEIFGTINEWTNFLNLLPEFGKNNLINKSAITSSFVASLELTKNGIVEVKQNEPFGNIFIRSKN